MIDEEGKEAVIISTAGGKLRLVVSNGKGIEIINELGDLKIKCRKLKAGGGEVSLKAGKGVKAGSRGSVEITGKEGVRFEAGGELKVKGENIRLNGSLGVTADGKPLAAEGFKVAGFDIHEMVVPSGSGTAVVPLPHPFLGKIREKVSDNVKVNGHNAATEGSVGKHDHAAHNQLPGTIRFNRKPAKEGEVTGGTAGTVKINGKAAAVAGSRVTTCDDTGQRDQSVILAPGAAMPMPKIINPENGKEYREERARGEKKKPGFTAARWGAARVKEGEGVVLRAEVKDIGDGNPVTFRVWKRGQDAAVTAVAQAEIIKEIAGGVAEGEFLYRLPATEGLPEEDPAFFFTAHSAWCAYRESGEATVELLRPGLSEAAWKDGGGKAAERGLAGERLLLTVSCNGDVAEGAGVVFRVYPAGADPKRARPVAELAGENRGGRAEAAWTWRYAHDAEEPLTEKPKFFFTAVSARSPEARSGDVEIGMNFIVVPETAGGEVIPNTRFTVSFSDGTTEEGAADGEGALRFPGKVPGIALWAEYENEEGAAVRLKLDRDAYLEGRDG